MEIQTEVVPAPGRALRRERERNARTWEVLQRLGVRDGDELRLDFSFASAGVDGDRLLATELRLLGYAVEIEPHGVAARTTPLAVGPAALDEWVEAMLGLSGLFQGWTATVSRGAG